MAGSSCPTARSWPRWPSDVLARTADRTSGSGSRLGPKRSDIASLGWDHAPPHQDHRHARACVRARGDPSGHDRGRLRRGAAQPGPRHGRPGDRAHAAGATPGGRDRARRRHPGRPARPQGAPDRVRRGRHGAARRRHGVGGTGYRSLGSRRALGGLSAADRRRRPRRRADRRRRRGRTAGHVQRRGIAQGHGQRRRPHARASGAAHPVRSAHDGNADRRGPVLPRCPCRGRRRHDRHVLRPLSPRHPPDRGGAAAAGSADRRQDRNAGGGRKPRGDPRGGRSGHGGARRPGHRVRHRGAAPPAKEHHPQLHRLGPAGDHGHPDARIDGARRRPDPGRDHRRRQRHLRRR